MTGVSGIAGGWANTNLNGNYIQFSNDRNNWEDLFKIEGVPNGIKTFVFQTVLAQY